MIGQLPNVFTPLWHTGQQSSCVGFSLLVQYSYHLYTLCERKKWADEARAYNELIGSWHAIVAASHEAGHRNTQSEFDLDF